MSKVRERFASAAVRLFFRSHVSKRGKTYKRRTKRFPAGGR